MSELGAVEALIPGDAPTRPRAVAVLDGVLAGQLWTDDPDRPTWAIVIETADGTTYCGGDVTAERLGRALAEVETASNEIVVGFSGPADPVRGVLPPDPFHIGEAIDFTDRSAPSDEPDALTATAPSGLRLADLDASVLPRIEWYEDTLHAFGSLEAWTERGMGRCLMDGDAVVAQGMAGPVNRGLAEMGVWTDDRHRRRGYGLLVSRLTAAACEAAGHAVWWNTSATNHASIRIARGLGFRRERRYDLVGYRLDAIQAR